MNPTALLTQLTELGIKLAVEGETIRVSPKSKLTPQMVSDLRKSKQDMMLLLRKEQEVTLSPLYDDLLLLEALVWSGCYEGRNVEKLKNHLRHWFERGDEEALESLLVYLEDDNVQKVLREVS
jgi:hypothetical protein